MKTVGYEAFGYKYFILTYSVIESCKISVSAKDKPASLGAFNFNFKDLEKKNKSSSLHFCILMVSERILL